MSFLRRLFDPGRDARREAARARAEEEARQGRIREGTAAIDNTFAQFNDDFYSGIASSFMDFARPQLDEQFGEAREQTTFDLARRGMLDSSNRVERFGNLDRRYNLELDNLTDQGQQFANDARANVERNRADLVGMLNATGDAQAATQGALSRASIVSRPPAFSPIGQLFQDGTAALAQQAALERSAALGSPVQPRFNTGLFGAPRNAVKVG